MQLAVQRCRNPRNEEKEGEGYRKMVRKNGVFFISLKEKEKEYVIYIDTERSHLLPRWKPLIGIVTT